jgi:hypothetical protein
MGIDYRTGDIELSTSPVRNDEGQDLETLNVFGRAEDGEVFSLPPADGGKDAWLFLASCVIFEAVSWGKSVASFAQSHASPFFPLTLFTHLTTQSRVSFQFWCLPIILRATLRKQRFQHRRHWYHGNRSDVRIGPLLVHRLEDESSIPQTEYLCWLCYNDSLPHRRVFCKISQPAHRNPRSHVCYRRLHALLPSFHLLGRVVCAQA